VRERVIEMDTAKSSKELSNIDVVVYAIFRLGGIEKKIHTEDIAMECFKLSKERFSWTLPEYKLKMLFIRPLKS
jgi:hypothetical protein